MMRNSNPWPVSIYNFFSDVMNRQMETIWKAGETKDLVKQGEWKEAAKTVPALTASLFAYAIWPAIVETWVSPHPHKDDGFAVGLLHFVADPVWVLARLKLDDAYNKADLEPRIVAADKVADVERCCGQRER